MKLIDQDGHTVKMSVDEVAACLKDMGNPSGSYLFVHDTQAKYPDEVAAIRSIKRPDQLYSRFTLWRKKRMGSKLLDRKVMAPLLNGIGGGYIDVKAEPVWLRLKGKEPVTVYVS
jgi:hypothetical protein